MEAQTESAPAVAPEGSTPEQAQGVQAALDKMSGTPAPEQKQEPAAAPPPEPEKPAVEKTTDIWDGASAEARKEFESLQNKIKSDDGRVAKALKEAQAAREALEKHTQPKEEQPPSGLAHDYPEAAKWKETLTQQEQVIATLKGQIEDVTVGALDASRPGWRDTVGSKEFKQWLVIQDASLQEKFHSTKLSDNIAILDEFKKHDEGKKAAVDTVKQERASRLESAQTVDSRSSPGVDTPPVDREAGFQAALQRVREKNHMK